MKPTKYLTEADVTPESVFNMQRRQVLKTLGLSAAAPGKAQADVLSWFKGHDRPAAPAGRALDFSKPEKYQANLTLTPEDKVSGYNNFIDGEVAKPVTLNMDNIFKKFAMEQRIYRMRCVEA